MDVSTGDPAPTFSAKAHTGETVSLEELRGRWVVLYFYPADDTPGCTKEACAFRDSHDDFTEAGAVVVGVSGNSLESHDRFAAKHDLPFPLISDEDGSLRAAYGVKKTLGLLPGRVTFVIDPDGIVRSVFSSQLRATRHRAEALAAVRGSQS